MRTKRRVPEVLWRLFGNRPSTLADTITSLLPPHPSSSVPDDCRFCKGRRCLSCTGPNGMSFLLRPNDPSDYRNLLDHCYVVVSENAPALTRFSPDSLWSQIEIVRAVIEATMVEQPLSSNVICSGYDKCNQSSPIVELLTSPAWSRLLDRVGNGVMVYLLRNASIFLPIQRKKHEQVTGPPISDLCREKMKPAPQSQHQQSLHNPCGPQKKRQRDDNIQSMLKRQQLCSSFGTDGTFGSVTCNGCCSDSRFDRNKHSNTEAAVATTSTISDGYEGNVNQELKQSSERLRKRRRPFKWERCRKRRQLTSQETSIEGPFSSVLTDKESLPGRLSSCLKPSSGHHDEKCSCLGFQVPQKVAKGAEIDRKSMFYNMERSLSVFPKQHVLNSLKPNSVGSEFLVKSIFGISDTEGSQSKCPRGSGLCLRGSACLYHSLVKSFKVLIRRAQHCHYLRLLEKHCVVSSPNPSAIKTCGCIFEGEKWDNNVLKKSQCCITDSCNSSPEAVDSHSEEIKSYSLKSQVESFIWAVCRSIIPPDLLGTPSNWRILRRNISKFIHLRRFEKFSLKQCMHNLKTSRFPFLSDNQYFCCMNDQALKDVDGKSSDIHKGFTKLSDATHILKQKVLESWMYWLFSSIIVPLLQANFYVTESEQGKQDVYYYQKSVWEKVKNKTITCMKDQRYYYLDDATTRRIIRKRSFGFSKLRICPKECGVRLLANLKASSKMPRQGVYLGYQSSGRLRRTKIHQKRVRFEHFKSVNRVLRDTHAVIKAIQLKEPEKLGSSVFDYNDVYRKLCPFIVGLKNQLAMMPAVFIVVSDVSKAFDSVDQDKLLYVMKDILRMEKYVLEHSYEVLCTKKSLWVHETPVLVGQNTSAVFKSSVRHRSLHSVLLVNQECSRSLKKQELFFNLNQHVKRNVLQLDKKFYLQGVGIPQGSVLSSMLCSLYYGHLDRNVIFPFLEKTWEAATVDLSRGHNVEDASSAQSGSEDKVSSSSGYILLRFIDDFLFISTSRKQAASFFSRLQRGFRDYNCFMNEKKFCVNFDVQHIPGKPSNRVYLGEDNIQFLRWSGLLINSCTLEVQADYSKYLNSHLSSTLTVSWQGQPGHHLKEKLCDYMRPKCHPIFFDSNINSASVVRLNIYQAFLLCAMKFHCYVRDLSNIWKLRTRSYVSIIKRSLRYYHVLIKRRVHSAYNGSDFHPILQLEKGEVEWLGLYAYIQVLQRKQSRYKELLSLLKSKLLNHKITGSVSSQLSYAVDRSHSSLLWKIKY